MSLDTGKRRAAGSSTDAMANPPARVYGFDWRGFRARLCTADEALARRVGRFLDRPPKREAGRPSESADSVVWVAPEDGGHEDGGHEDGGHCVRTTDWSARASGPDEVLFLTLEALGQIFLYGLKGAVLHAGAFEVGPGAIVFHGPPQIGKTSLGHAAWRRGLAVLGDDRVVLREDADAVEPFPKCLKLRLSPGASVGEASHGVPETMTAAALVGAERRVMLARALPGFSAYDRALPIHALVRLERATSGPSRLVPLEPDAALDAVMGCITSPDFEPMAVVRLLKRLAEANALHRLAVGEHETEAALDLLLALAP